jgi:hypothetical protein
VSPTWHGRVSFMFVFEVDEGKQWIWWDCSRTHVCDSENQVQWLLLKGCHSDKKIGVISGVI